MRHWPVLVIAGVLWYWVLCYVVRILYHLRFERMIGRRWAEAVEKNDWEMCERYYRMTQKFSETSDFPRTLSPRHWWRMFHTDWLA